MNPRALRAATIALLATAVSVASPGQLDAQALACDAGENEVRGLEFRGNRAISDDDLSLRILTTPSSRARRIGLPLGEKRCVNSAELPRDMERLRFYYRDRGYYRARIDTLVEPVGRTAVRVVFLINEGEPLRLQSYEITGLQGIPDSADIMRRLRLRVGAPFDVLLYSADIDSIMRRLRDAGYYRANYVPGREWDTVNVKATASIEVIPGKVMFFSEPEIKITPVDLKHPQQIATPVVRRLLGIATGQRYSDRAIVDAQRNLFQIGGYQHIEVAPLPDSLQPSPDSVKLTVQLVEDYMRELDSEYGWATLDCGRIRLLYTDKNLLGTARRLEVTGQASKLGFGEPIATPASADVCNTLSNRDLAKDSAFSRKFHYFTGATLRQPRFLGTRLIPTVSVYSERRGDFRAFLRSTEIGGELSGTYDFDERTPLRVAYTVEYGRTEAEAAALCALFNRCGDESARRINELATLGVASATLARFRTDNLVNPTRGWSVRSEVRTSASKALFTSPELFFNKGTLDMAFYYPIDGRNTLALRLRGGAVFGRRLSLDDPTGFIPPQERLYAGGPTSVRGFQQNELGSLVYIARESDVVIDSTTTPGLFSFQLRANPVTPEQPEITYPAPERSVPLGGNSLLVANLEYRIRDPFFSPGLLQYTLFMDGGDVWTRAPNTKKMQVKWTPGIGIRATTPVGPFQVNIGYNSYRREPGSLYFNSVTSLTCATPNNQLRYRQTAPGRFELDDVASGGETECPAHRPPPRDRLLQKLTFTFSLGTDF